MKDPVLSLSTGVSFERSAIKKWQAENGDVCPITGSSLGFLVDNEELKAEIYAWKQQIKGYRRIQRRSPTSYILANAKPAATTKPKKEMTDQTEKDEKFKEEMFRRLKHTVQAFTDAGMSDYMGRVNDGEKEEHKPKIRNNSRFLEALAETPRYEYNLEYHSIFRQGPTMSFPSTI